MPNSMSKNYSDKEGYWEVDGILNAMKKGLGPAKDDLDVHHTAHKLWLKHRWDLKKGMEETSAEVGRLKKILQNRTKEFGTSLILVDYWANHFIFMALAVEAGI